MLNFFGGVFYFFIALGILVSIHEFGHFITARLCGVKVLRFSLGFGPILFKRTGKDGCEYAISAIPLGGYVKMKGENEPTQDRTTLDKDTFKAQPVFKRALIIAAGPLANIILAIFLFTIVNINGEQQSYAVISDVSADSIADISGFKAKDKITSLDNEAIDSWQQFVYKSVAFIGSDKNIKVQVTENYGKGATRELNLNLKNLVLGRNESIIEKIGLSPAIGDATNEINVVLKDSPAQSAGLKKGDAIVSVNGVETNNWYAIQHAILDSDFKPLNLVVLRDQNKYSTTVNTIAKYNSLLKKDTPFVGIGPKVNQIDGLFHNVSYGPVDAFVKAIDDAYTTSKLVIISIYKLASQKISAENISGPIAIAQVAQSSASYGFISFIIFLAAISVNLGILNLIPIPILDGGQLVFLVYEAIMGKEPSPRVQAFLTSLGAAILLSLMIFAVFNDVRSL